MGINIFRDLRDLASCGHQRQAAQSRTNKWIIVILSILATPTILFIGWLVWRLGPVEAIRAILFLVFQG